MSRAPGGRFHLWFWVTAGVLLYVASCPPVEAWHDRQQYSNALPLTAAPPAMRPVGRSAEEFEIVEVGFVQPVARPKWMEVLYAPVHFVEQYPPFAALFQRYRLWCDGWF
jgi:hypothetical protein